MPTPLRNVRVPDDIWEAAQARAAAEETTVSAVIVNHLIEYGGTTKNGPELSPYG